MAQVYISLAKLMLSVLDPLFVHLFELLKNKFLTWIASVDKKVEESRKLGVVVSGKFAYSGRFAPLPCTVYLVYILIPSLGRSGSTCTRFNKHLFVKVDCLYRLV